MFHGESYDPEPHHTGFSADDFDLEKISEWFGAPFATLKAPANKNRHVSSLFSESSHAVALGPVQPVHVTIRHHLLDGSIVDVSTLRLDHHETTVIDHLWSTFTSFQLASMSTAGIRFPESLPPPEAQDRIGMSRRPDPGTILAVVINVDGEPSNWEHLIDEEFVSGAALGLYGGRVDDVLVAVIGDESKLHALELETYSGS
jgi:hypothetical protein